KIAIKYMDQNYYKKITINDIALQCSMSPSQLARDFKKYTGLSLHNYLLKIRIKEAESLLVKDKTIPLEKIAVSSGFTDASHLYKKIKEATGMSPGQFRKKYY
ncbi:helix-turn-helix domain-containing protein, partial [Gilliamella apicola]|uniref:helix-turn-helix domain-containing protein n=2 Tax=Bacteria TaxID=2 RepID=UPI0009E60D3A